jgi:prepilin-type N-terminal cleavage/methylation domain-containing protein
MRMTARLRREEEGFSLIELLMAMALGSIVLTAVMSVFLTGMGATTRVTDRVESAQRGRLAMDRVVTLLNSQTCLYNNDGSSSAPVVDGQAQQMTFLANLGTVSADPSKYRIRYDTATKTLFEDSWAPTRDTKGNIVYAATATSSKPIGTGIVPTLSGGTIFQYYAFKTDGTIDMLAPIALTAGALTTASRLTAVRVSATFAAQTDRTKTLDLLSTTQSGSATVGSADGSDPSKGVNC